MRTFARLFWAPKAGNTPEEYQDASAPDIDADSGSDGEVQRFAVADGASEAIYSGKWASILARAWVTRSLNVSDEMLGELHKLSECWTNSLSRENLPWWAEEKISTGSFATLAAIELRGATAGCEWRFAAVGDSCVFLRRDGDTQSLGPLTESEAFSNSPYLLATNKNALGELSEAIFRREGKLKAGDEFFLVTDALAHWATLQLERGEPLEAAFPFIEASSDPPFEFLDWADRLRSEKYLRNDDITLLQVTVTEL